MAATFSFTTSVLRPDDLLVLRFGFVNLELQTDPEPHLARIDRAADAYLVVSFPTQHLQERAFFESAAKREPLTPAPVAAVAADDSRVAFKLPDGVMGIPYTLESLLDWRALEPSLAPNALPPAPTPAELGGKPRPQEPEDIHTALELPYRMVLSPSRLAAWSHSTRARVRDGRAELWHTRLAAAGPDGTIDEGDLAGRSVRAIWAPELAPPSLFGRHSAWPLGVHQQSVTPYQREIIVKVCGDFGLTVVGGTYRPRAIETRRLMLSALGGWLDIEGHWPTPDVPEPTPGLGGLFGDHLEDIDVAIRDEVLLAERAREVFEPEPHRPLPAITATAAGELTLGPALEATFPPIKLVPTDTGLGEVGWIHRARGGRDEYVEVLQPGLFWCHGHLATVQWITERKFEPDQIGLTAAVLRKRLRIKVTQPRREYWRSADGFPHRGREYPFTELRFTTLITPDLDLPPAFSTVPSPPNGSSEPPPPPDVVPFVPSVGGVPYRFEFVARDREGREVHGSAPMLFVPLVVAEPLSTTLANGVAGWAKPESKPCRDVLLRGKDLAFADLVSGDEPGATSSPCESLEIDVAVADVTVRPSVPMGEAPVLPRMTLASVRLPALGQIAGPAAAQTLVQIAYPQVFLDDAANPSRLYAELQGSVAAPAKPDASGGVAAPSFSVQALSSQLGPVADKAGMTSGGFDPAAFFPSAKLLGSIDLKLLLPTGETWSAPADVYPPELRGLTPDALRAKLDEPGTLLRVPVLATQVVGPAGAQVVETLYAWKPRIEAPGAAIAGILEFELTGDAANPSKLVLVVNARSPVGGGAGTFSVEGWLDHFALDFASVIRIQFERFAFKAAADNRIDANVTGVDVAFHGALEFVRTIQDILPSDGFSDPPYLTALSTGVTAGYSLGVPTVGVGVVSLENLALDAAVSLPFTGDPAGVRFAISTRAKPFLVTVSLFGGGGFFSITVNTSGPPQIEAAIEFGGNFSLDIGVASGNVHVMAGIYFAMLGKQVKLSGYFRLGGSVEVLGIITVSVEFYLALTYDSGKAYGEATLTVSVKVLGLSKSVSLHVERKIAGAAGDPTFAQLVDPAAWQDYCLAFGS